jgi:exosome complex component RRP46
MLFHHTIALLALLFSLGPHAQALATVSGPIEVRLAAENASRATLEVHVRPLAAIAGTEHKALASSIATALQPSLILTQNPRSLVQLIVQDLTPLSAFTRTRRWADADSESGMDLVSETKYAKDRALAGMINASSLAFLKAGSVPMRGVVCAVFLACLHGEDDAPGLCVVDPSEEEMKSVKAGGAFAFLFAGEATTCVWSNWQGKTGFAVEELLEARQKAQTAAEDVWYKIKAALSGDDGE